MKEKLSDLCREQKQVLTPRKTNQDVAENTDLSVGTVSQFFRGDIKNPSVYTVGPICREMGVSMDDYLIFRTKLPPPIPARWNPKGSALKTLLCSRSLPSSRDPFGCTGL